MDRQCLNCANLRGCGLLIGPRKELEWGKVFTLGSEQECPSWVQAGERETSMRWVLHEKYGLGAVRAIHLLPTTPDLRDRKEELDDMKEIEHLRSLADPSMTRAEREQQIIYETEEDGQLKHDRDGNPIARRGMVIRGYATEIGVPEEQSCFWSIKQITKSILKLEAENKMIASKTKKATKKVEKEKEEEMVSVVKKKVVVRGPVKSASAAAADEDKPKSAIPPKVRSRVASPATNKKAPPPKNENEAQGPEFDMEALVTSVADSVRKIVKAEVEGAKNELMTLVDLIRAEMVDQHTDLHDALLYKIQLMHTIDAETSALFSLEDPAEGLLREASVDIRAYREDDESVEEGVDSGE